MDLSTQYLGLKLKNPLMPGASPLVGNLDAVKRLEDAGAAAIVMHSLFEEQITRDEEALFAHTEGPAEAFAEATSFFPSLKDYALGPDTCLQQIGRIKEATDLPVIGSLNGVTAGGWIEYARMIEQAGADALELNIYRVATDPTESGAAVEAHMLGILKQVLEHVTIPVAVKLGSFLSSPAHFAAELDAAGAAGVILFNRFYQPDIDTEGLGATPRLELSTSGELCLRLRWAAIIYGHIRGSIGISGGVHRLDDVVKAIMTGASGVQLVSALLQRGPEHLGELCRDLARWLEVHEYESLQQMQGSMSLRHCPDPAAFERANYLRVLQLWRLDQANTQAWLRPLSPTQ